MKGFVIRLIDTVRINSVKRYPMNNTNACCYFRDDVVLLMKAL